MRVEVEHRDAAGESFVPQGGDRHRDVVDGAEPTGARNAGMVEATGQVQLPPRHVARRPPQARARRLQRGAAGEADARHDFGRSHVSRID